ncbi:restriction endonuclease subunit S [uncultured Draconibacterium sp.]|uniref:restriction endonuclease subunit S n=1 Tax=uncultured Draconibacterium sp. TaxID=1573823 RepID=UPI003216DD17
MREDWEEVELGEVCFTTSGGTPSRNNLEFYQGEIPWVKSGELDKGIIYDTEEHISEEAVKKSSAKIFPEGTLLIALYGATIGKLAFLGVEATTNQAICGIYKSQAIASKYLYNFLLNRKQKLISQGTGGAQPNISQTILKKLSVPLAPLPIQRAIVSKIEALFSDLDNGIANFKTAQAQLKIYRQAVLKKAFEGKLSELGKVGLKDDRIIEEEILKSNNPKNPNSDNLPKGWKWVKLGEVALVNTGSTPKRGNSKYWDNGTIPWITSGALNELFVNKADEYITETALKETNCKIISEGSLLVAMYGEGKTRGKCSELKIDAATNQAIATISMLNEYSKSKVFVKWFFIMNYEEIRLLSSGGVQPNLNLSIIKNTIIPFPPIAEQTQIVQEIESRLSVCDKVEQSISESLIKAEALRQSILKKAFEGKLLSEAEIEQCKKEADYEPASGLLTRIERSRNEKIKAEKLAKEQEQKKATTKKKSKK